ncbi:hypothetical protein ACTXIU_13015 [Glutamicibacter arilaitensis]
MSKEQCIAGIERLNAVIAHRREMCNGSDPEAYELYEARNRYQRMLSTMK